MWRRTDKVCSCKKGISINAWHAYCHISSSEFVKLVVQIGTKIHGCFPAMCSSWYDCIPQSRCQTTHNIFMYCFKTMSELTMNAKLSARLNREQKHEFWQELGVGINGRVGMLHISVSLSLDKCQLKVKYKNNKHCRTNVSWEVAIIKTVPGYP